VETQGQLVVFESDLPLGEDLVNDSSIHDENQVADFPLLSLRRDIPDNAGRAPVARAIRKSRHRFPRDKGV
jgi:hypothetical protein